MEYFLHFYQFLPYRLNPTALSFGSLSIGWYSLSYLAGFISVYLLLRYRLKKNEFSIANPLLFDFLLYALIGLLVGARLGYVFFYDFSYFWQNPLLVVSPFDPDGGRFMGIYGLSFHGGLLGIILAVLIFCRKYKLGFLNLANFFSAAVPAGYFFGRIGNFLNGELYGRVTQKFWGMYFPADGPVLRHPSQLYEALLEGILLFAVLWTLRNHARLKRHLFPFFLVGYSLARITAEFFREPDPQLGLIWHFATLGQILSLIMLIFGVALFRLEKKPAKC